MELPDTAHGDNVVLLAEHEHGFGRDDGGGWLLEDVRVRDAASRVPQHDFGGEDRRIMKLGMATRMNYLHKHVLCIVGAETA